MSVKYFREAAIEAHVMPDDLEAFAGAVLIGKQQAEIELHATRIGVFLGGDYCNDLEPWTTRVYDNGDKQRTPGHPGWVDLQPDQLTAKYGVDTESDFTASINRIIDLHQGGNEVVRKFICRFGLLRLSGEVSLPDDPGLEYLLARGVELGATLDIQNVRTHFTANPSNEPLPVTFQLATATSEEPFPGQPQPEPEPRRTFWGKR
ncbi:hypothetical protein BH09PAT3_BH09PAT3_5650 [soil metagenome]